MIKRKFQTLTQVVRRGYKLLDPDEYIFNQRESNVTRKIKEATLRPLPGASILIRSRSRLKR